VPPPSAFADAAVTVARTETYQVLSIGPGGHENGPTQNVRDYEDEELGVS